MASHIEHSKAHWQVKDDDGSFPGFDRIQSGCFQRIANSLENMEKPYLRLLTDTEYLQRRHRELNEANGKLHRRISALQGVITKMKKKK